MTIQLSQENKYAPSIALERFPTAHSLHISIIHLLNKRWSLQQKPFVDAMIRILIKERDLLILLGKSELSQISYPSLQELEDAIAKEESSAEGSKAV